MQSKKNRKPIFLSEPWEADFKKHEEVCNRFTQAFGYPISLPGICNEPMQLEYLLRLIPDKPDMLIIGMRLVCLSLPLN